MKRYLEYTPRGDSFDPLKARWQAYVALWRALWRNRVWLTGAGPDTTERFLQRYAARTREAVPSGAAFNEPLQLCYEYGLFGFIAILTLLALALPNLKPGDPWSAAWVAGATLSLFHWPCRLPMTGSVFLAITVKVLHA